MFLWCSKQPDSSHRGKGTVLNWNFFIFLSLCTPALFLSPFFLSFLSWTAEPLTCLKPTNTPVSNFLFETKSQEMCGPWCHMVWQQKMRVKQGQWESFFPHYYSCCRQYLDTLHFAVSALKLFDAFNIVVRGWDIPAGVCYTCSLLVLMVLLLQGPSTAEWIHRTQRQKGINSVPVKSLGQPTRAFHSI